MLLFIVGLLNLFTLSISSLSLGPPAELFSPLIPQKLLATVHTINSNPGKYPQFTNVAGTWQYFSPNSWSSGFLPAAPYALNERRKLCPPTPENGLGIANWLALGRSATANLIPPEPECSPDHDRAFLVAFLEELAINPDNTTAQAAVIDFAGILANRFNSAVGCTRSWDGSEPYVSFNSFHVIIDNMMSLEFLFIAAELTQNSTLYDIAVSHADTTMKNHIREDGSTWHIVEYNSTTGEVVRKRTAQGYSDDSTWSRGQAWAIYGFANVFKRTGDEKYLDIARCLAGYFLSRIPDDGIIPWDFDAPLLPAPRPADSSAATIAAAGLLLLAQNEIDEGNAVYYTESATQIVFNTTSLAWAPSWKSLLSNATVSEPAGNAMTGMMYGVSGIGVVQVHES
ncbi:hypothetical protein H0H87_004956 [Tephrocybe sp. NHM501043]|nr:hypothetical protein H0H87_004956 [Tephrocybe sp. NHM501043]